MRITPERLEGIVRRILDGGPRVPWTVAADPARAALARIERIARGALRVGTLRDRRSGRGLPVFGSRLGGRAYRILVLPRGASDGEIVAIRPAEEGELEQEIVPSQGSVTIPNPSGQGNITVNFQKYDANSQKNYRVRGAHVRVTWTGPTSADQLENAQNVPGDLYVLARKAGNGYWPLYVGQTGNFVQRWAPRFKVLREFDVDLTQYAVWTGVIATLQSQLPANVSIGLVRDDVEHVLIRHINKALQQHNGALKNESSYLPFFAAPLGVNVVNVFVPGNSLPPFVPGQIQVGADQLYEMEADPFATG
ncbi:MAG TPA: hypothetical protein VF771_17505 [Longimicrobiaceae bacterium]